MMRNISTIAQMKMHVEMHPESTANILFTKGEKLLILVVLILSMLH